MKRAALVLILVLFFSGCVTDSNKSFSRACFSDKTCVKLEIAKTHAQRQHGLMHRESLDADAGMLFIFDGQARHSFWMKNTLIPLDMIWLDDGGIVVDVKTAQPCWKNPCPSYRPKADALYVLEVNAGEAAKRGVTAGSVVQLK